MTAPGFILLICGWLPPISAYLVLVLSLPKETAGGALIGFVHAPAIGTRVIVGSFIFGVTLGGAHPRLALTLALGDHRRRPP